MDKKLYFTKAEEMSLSDATKPLLVVSRLVGMNPKLNWHKIYTASILAYEFVLLIYVWEFHCRRILPSSYFSVLVHALKDSCRTSSNLVIFFFSFVDRNRFVVPVKKFANLDRSLKSLGGILDNRGVYRSVIFQIAWLVPVLILCVIFDIYSSLNPVTDTNYRKIVWLSCSYQLITNVVCTATDYCFSASLSIIRKRFEQINLIIRRAGNRGPYLRINFLEDSSERSEYDVLGKLKVLRRQYHELWMISRRVNKAYGPHLLVGAATSLAVITMEIWKTFYIISSTREINFIIVFGNVIWVCFYIPRICILAEACESTVAEGKRTADALQELGMTEDHSCATKGEIRDFLLQIQSEARNFTACKFFDVNFKIVCSIFGAAWTYLVILIQMDSSNNCTQAGYDNKSTNF